MLSRSRGAVSLVLCASLVASAPGPAAWAAVAKEIPVLEPAKVVLPEAPVLPTVVPTLGTQSLPSIEAVAPEALANPALSATPQPAAEAQVPTMAGQSMYAARTALPVAQAAERTASAVLAHPDSSADALSASAGAAFDVMRPSLESSADAPVIGDSNASSVSLARAKSVDNSASRVVVPVAKRSIVTRAIAAASVQPVYVKVAAVAVFAAATLVFPKVSAVSVPLLLATCNSMRERAIKDATILPQQQTQQEIAKKELDALLVNFGKRVKEEAQNDARVTSDVSAHAAEHAMEEPVLEKLPDFKARWAAGEELTKEAALKELRDAVVARLKTRFPNESDQVIEELLQKSGGWDELLKWEKRHDVLDQLKKAAQEKPAETQAELKKIMQQAGGGHSHGHSHGGAALGIALIAGLALAHLAFGVPGAVLAGVGIMAGTLAADNAPPQPPVELDTYLASLKLSKEEIDFLKEYTLDIGARDMAPIIGRSKELRRAITILSKPAGTQNNPMILGDKGVGKTAIVEGVARYLYQNRLPSLRGKRILELDSGRLVAGAGIQGELEKRLTTLRKILAKTDNKVILFVDEIHSILKNNATSNSVPDLLKSPLRNGEMTVIGATTMGEYRKYVEQDPAFADRFDTINVNEPNEEEAIEMLEGDLEYLERKFDVEIDPDAAKAAVKLSTRYIPEKFLPRKARQLLESAIADAKPEAARDGLQVQVDQLTDRLRILVKRYAALKAQDKAALKGTPSGEVVMAYNRVVGIYQTILSLEDQRGSIVKEKINKSHILRTLSKETGIPVGDMGEDEYKRLMRMEPWFKERIVGQDDAIKALADTVRTNKAGLSDPNRPQGVFMFAGKTGVGKTALTKSLADFLFGDPDAVIRLDMSEYMEKFAVQRMFGAPPGYVGYDQGGELTEKVRRRPYSVILLDEIEKAHPDVLNALLQVFDAGRMTDGKGNTVNFKNTIIVMTTNLGAGSTAEGQQFKDDVMEMIRQRLRPEFVNRVDKTVVFNPIDKPQAESITKIMIKDVEKRLREQDLDLRVSPEAVTFLADKGFDPAYGARPLKRVVENDVTNALSPFLLKKKAEGSLAHGGVVEVVMKDGQIAFDLKPNPPPSVELAPLPPGPLGDKLRRILEQAASGEGVAGDIDTFEGALFPDRKAVTLDKPLGSFRPEAGPSLEAGRVQELSATKPGVKDEGLSKVKADAKPLWASDAFAEAGNAWLDAFVRAAKELSPRSAPTVRVGASAETGEIAMTIEAAADAGFAARQKLARKAMEHFSESLPDEAAARARAASLKDEGRAADLDWLEVKRLVDAIPGATFGWASVEENGGSWRFWVRLPGAFKQEAKGSEETKSAETSIPEASKSEAPVAAMEARLTPAKMFLFLTQRTPESMAARRTLIAGMLDSKSTQVRLIGLHLAAALLSPAAWREVASTVRMLRLSDLKDYALFSELAARHPGVPMTAQRQALIDSYESSLRTVRGVGGRGEYGMDGYARTARRYAGLARPVLGPVDPGVSDKDAAESARYRRRFRKIGAIFASITLPVLGALAFVTHLYHWPLVGQIFMLAAVAGISLWIYLGNFLEIRRGGPRDAALYEAAVLDRLTDQERLKVARRWLDAAAAGRVYFSTEDEAALLAPILDQMPKDEKLKIFKRWSADLEAALAKSQEKPNRTSPEVFNTMGLLARLLPRMPEEVRGAAAKALLVPLRGRWLPSGSDDYLAGLGSWVAAAPLSPEELEDLLGTVINFPMSNQTRLSSFLPIFKGIAQRPGLTLTARASLDQAFAGLSAEASSRREFFEMVELARLRVKLRTSVDVWGGLKELLEYGNANNVVSWQTFQALDRLAVEAPPTDAEKDAMIKAFKPALASRGAQDKAYGELFLARLTGSREARLEAALAIIRDVSVREDSMLEAIDGEALDEVAAIIADPMRGDADTKALWDEIVRENAARLDKER